MGTYGINRLDSAVMPGHKSDLLAASMPPCATYKDQGCQIATPTSGEKHRVKVGMHVCVGARKLPTTRPLQPNEFAVVHLYLYAVFPMQTRVFSFCGSGLPLSLQLLRHFL